MEIFELDWLPTDSDLATIYPDEVSPDPDSFFAHWVED